MSSCRTKPVDSLTIDIVQRVAAATGIDETEFTLFDYVDPDALDALYAHSLANDDADWALELTVDGVTVVISSDGEITVGP